MSGTESETETPNFIGAITLKHKLGTFAYAGYPGSFCYHNHHYEDAHQLRRYLVAPEPLRTPTGRIVKRQPKRETQPAMWWKAQCLFRGLSTKGKAEEMEKNLVGHEADAMIEELQLLLLKAKKEFKSENKEAENARWLKMTADQKRHYDAKRYLTEAFPQGQKSDKVVAFKAGNWGYIVSVAESRGLISEATAAPVDRNGFGPKKWIVIGQQKAPVMEMVQKYTRETRRIETEREQAEGELRRKNDEAAKKRQKEIDEGLAKCKDWDPTGTWKISCPYIEKNWGVDKMELAIYMDEKGKGPQMFAEFDFGVLHGIFRFERQPGEKATLRATGDNSPIANLDDESDEDEYYDDGEGRSSRRSPTPEGFYLGKSTQPSPKHTTWEYRWRGQGHDTTELEIGSDDDVYSVEFCGPKGRTPKGTFGGGYCTKCEFTGIKALAPVPKAINIAREWRNRNEAAYDYYARARWH